VLREGKEKHLNLMLGSRVKEVSLEGDLIHKLGVNVEEITPENAHKYSVKTDEKGLVITKVLPGSIAQKAGWREGGIIMVVNGQKVNSISDLKKVLEKSSPKDRIVVLHNFRGKASFYSLPHPMG
jgi:serine protease Do